MNIVVCCKIIPDPEDIEIKADESISVDHAEWMLSSFDLQAVETGVRLVDAQGGKVIAISAGPPAIDNSRLKKDLLSRGPDELTLVVDDAMQTADTCITSSVLERAIKRIGDVDLVLCGEGSADLYFQQVGLQIGEKLGWPTLNAISKITPEEGKLVVERRLEDEVEVLEVPLPAALSVTTDITTPRLPTLKEILKAGKKPATTWSLADLGLDQNPLPQVEVVTTRAPVQKQRKKVVISGEPEEAAQKLAVYLIKEGAV
jgi:electron transfer flavoprotein beta subunit